MWKKILQSQGSIALILVIMITSLTLISAVALTLVNISEKMANYQLEENENVLNQKQACLDDALARISNDNYATGTYALDLTDVHCYYQISETITGLKTVTTTASSLSSIGTWSQSLKAIVNVSSTPISITSHQDIVGPTWDRTNWGRRMRISVQPNKVAGDLYNFPVYVNLADLGDDFFNAVQSDGSDIVVTLGDGTTKLARELVNINTATNIGELHFFAPYLSPQVATDFYIYFGNAAAAETNDYMWFTNYSLVQHLDEDPSGSAPQMLDSSQRANHAASAGAMTTGDLVTAKIGRGLDFDGLLDGNGDYLSITNPGNMNSSQGTISFWVNFNTVTPGMFLNFYESGPDSVYVYFFDSGVPYMSFDILNNSVTTVSRAYQNPNTSGWHKMDWRQDGSGVDLFFDGQAVSLIGSDSSTEWTSHLNMSQLRIANQVSGPFNLAGKMDELRVTNKALSASWLATEYNNQFDSDTFYSTTTIENLGCAGVSMFGYCWYQASAVDISCDAVCAENSLTCVSGVSYSDPTCSLNIALGSYPPGTCTGGAACVNADGSGVSYSPANHVSVDACLYDTESPTYNCATVPNSGGSYKLICACE